MPWYKAGTVSVAQNSNTVNGTGTSFIANARVGDAFRGPDGGWYEVTNIVSNTAMSISPAYQGATASSGAYALAPMQGYVKDSADALRALVNQFGSVMAVLGMTGTVDGVRTALNLSDTGGLAEGSNQYFTAARVRASVLTGLVLTDGSAVLATDSVLAAFGKLQAQVTAALPKAGGAMTGAINEAPTVSMASAATVDIGSAASNTVLITGTTTITSLGTAAPGVRRAVRFSASLVLTYNGTSLYLLGGANITTAANDSAEFVSLGGGQWVCLRYNLANGKPLTFAYDRSNLVGIVSQSGGVVTGAAVQSGTTSNGTFTKYADGTMTCSYKGLAAAATAGVDFTVAGFWGFPAPFISPPAVVAEMGLNPTVTFNFVISKKICVSSATQMDFRFRADQSQTYYWDLIAYGRWY